MSAADSNSQPFDWESDSLTIRPRLPITLQQCHRLIASMPRRIEAVISAKGFPTKY
uniref:Uncharacterized protein n=1 Tax=Cyprinus carpio carpio TaxID=630221 RepID=A0A9J7WZY8_CYPCA